MLENICKNCFEKTNTSPCPKCGYNGEQNKDKEILPVGTILSGKYIIGKNLGRGGFGVTYLALDLNLDLKICIKEYFPASISTRARDTSNIIPYTGDDRDNYDRGREKFVEEGKALAKFNKLKATTIIHDFFMENNTGYLVMEYLDGEDVSHMLKKSPNKKLSFEKTMEIMIPIMDTLEQVHKSGLIHRDISPDNIFVTTEGQAKLLDFGAARYAEGDKKSLSVILKHGYAPPEQYSSRGKQGTWTDVYALGATMFKMLMGKTPVESGERQLDDTEFAEDMKLLDENIRYVLEKAMAFKPNERMQNVEEFKKALENVSKDKTFAVEDIKPVVELKMEKVNSESVEKPIERLEQQPRSDEKFSQRQRSDIKPKANGRNYKYIVFALCAVLAVLVLLVARTAAGNNDAAPTQELKAVAETIHPIEMEENQVYMVEQTEVEKTNHTSEIEQDKLDKYNHAIKLREEKKYLEAINLLRQIEGYKNADEIVVEIMVEMNTKSISASTNHTAALKNDGTAVTIGLNNNGQCDIKNRNDIVSISLYFDHTIGLKDDGTVIELGSNKYQYHDVSDWNDIVSISSTIGLKSDGTAVSVGYADAKFDVSDWSDIVSICDGGFHAVGLKSDGTVVAVGENRYGQCDVSHWSDIVYVTAGFRHTVGVKSDGTVVAVGDNSDGRCNVSNWSDIVSVSAASHTLGVKSDGTVVAVGSNVNGQCNVSTWKDIVSVSAGEHHTVGLKSDGTMVAVGRNTYGQCDVEDWEDIKVVQNEVYNQIDESVKDNDAANLLKMNMNSISVGHRRTVGLKNDGTVVALGFNGDGRCDVSDWNDIVSISTGKSHTVGLKYDRTVVAVGDNEYGQCDISYWKDIVSISAGLGHTVGLKSDGTVIAVGYNNDEQCDVSDWNDIVNISVGDNHTVGLKSDGTVVAVGLNYSGQCNVSEWNDIVKIHAGSVHTIGLRSDGTVVAVGYNGYGQCDVSDWSDIVDISAGLYHTAGLRSDGTVIAIGRDSYGRCDVSDWNDIVNIFAGDNHTVGLKSDGTVVAVGVNEYGQCDVEDWSDIAIYE